MIFRAIFWIGLVSLLAPHEPDLGLGRPGAGTSTFFSAAIPFTAARLWQRDGACGSGCAGGLGLGDLIPIRNNPRLAAGLAEVKADIAADQRARAARRQAPLARGI